MGFSRYSIPQQGTLVRSGEERATLVRRTYSLVFASILVTMAGTAYALTNQAMMDAVRAHPFIGMLCVFAPLIGAQVARKSFPQNIGFVFLFTFAEGLYIAPFIAIAERYSPGVTAEAGVLTLAAFGALTLYAFVSRRDFSAWGGFLVTGVIVLFVAMLLVMFTGSAAGFTWIAAIGVLIFSGLLVFDTWRMRNAFGPDDYVMAAVSIYLDLLNMFVFILSLLSGGRRN
ncbi:MAG TPA: Bax inhibitor-1/YccA family protein [Gemmatimonadaceae bacterium]|jgi:FtsH-binding integral membrane protein